MMTSLRTGRRLALLEYLQRAALTTDTDRACRTWALHIRERSPPDLT